VVVICCDCFKEEWDVEAIKNKSTEGLCGTELKLKTRNYITTCDNILGENSIYVTWVTDVQLVRK